MSNAPRRVNGAMTRRSMVTGECSVMPLSSTDGPLVIDRLQAAANLIHYGASALRAGAAQTALANFAPIVPR